MSEEEELDMLQVRITFTAYEGAHEGRRQNSGEDGLLNLI